MIIIPNKVVQEKDEFGVVQDVNYPAGEFPAHALRIVLDPAIGWQCCEDDKDVDAILTNYPSIKEIVDGQKDATIKIDPIDPIDPKG